SMSPRPFFLQALRTLRYLHSFPTRRSSDLPSSPSSERPPDPPKRLARPRALAASSRAPGVRPGSSSALPSNQSPEPCGVVRLRRSEEHTSELQSPYDLVCRLLLEKKKTQQ